MTEDKVVKLLSSPVEEDRILVGNWIIKNMTLLEIKNIFDKYGKSECSIEDGKGCYISGKCIENSIQHGNIVPYIRTSEYFLFLGTSVGLLQPWYGEDFDMSNFKNVEI